MSFREMLNESALSDIKNSDKIFLLVIGGSASGKNYVYEKNFNFDLVDVDAITKRLSGGDFEKARKMVSKAIAEANRELEDAFKSGKSIAQVTTGAGAKGVENKLKKAKEYGFETALLLVDTDWKVAYERNVKRAEDDKQGMIPDWKVEKTNKEARSTFNQLKKDVDYSTIIKN